MPPRPLRSRPPTLGDRIDQAMTLDDLLPLISGAACMENVAEGHRLADEVIVKALTLLTMGRPLQRTVREIVRRYEKMDKWYNCK